MASQLVCVAAILWLTACGGWPDFDVSFKQPDKDLYEKAVWAFEQKRYGVGRLTAQTLINTYPDSEYASKAKVLVENSQAACGETWNTGVECSGRTEEGSGREGIPPSEPEM